jgi:hypothetical protein
MVVALLSALLATFSVLGFIAWFTVGAGIQNAGAQPAGCPSGLPAGTTGPCAQNPALPAVCGHKFALVFDMSSSISATQLTQMKQAGDSVVTALTGTGSDIGVYTFGTWAPAFSAANSGSPAANSPLHASPVLTPGQAAVVQNKINGLTFPATPSGQTSPRYTNWQQGLLQELAGNTGGVHYDAVLFITDGVPTAFGALSAGPRSRSVPTPRAL